MISRERMMNSMKAYKCRKSPNEVFVIDDSQGIEILKIETYADLICMFEQIIMFSPRYIDVEDIFKALLEAFSENHKDSVVLLPEDKISIIDDIIRGFGALRKAKTLSEIANALATDLGD